MVVTHIPIHPQILRLDENIPFSVYTAGDDEDYSLFHEAGATYDSTIQGRLFDESIEALYVASSEYREFLSYLEHHFPTLIDDPFIRSATKAKIAYEIVAHLARELLERPDEVILDRYKRAVSGIVAFSGTDNGIRDLIAATNMKYHEHHHFVNVGIYALGLAREILDVPDELILEIAFGFFVHDIGKYTIPRSTILHKGPLGEDEWQLMKKHPEEGYKLLSRLKRASSESRVIVLQHHERHHGRGYPLGLRKEQIHPYAKLCAIADSFDALTSERPYRDAQSSFRALAIMQNEMKHDFDPEFFSKFVLLFSRETT